MNNLNDISNLMMRNIALTTNVMHDSILCEKIERAIHIIVKTLQEGGKVHFCGNGGSAADAQHLAAELSGRFLLDRKPLNAEALHCNTSYLTAVANDFGYDAVFARLLEGQGKKGDVCVGLSTSGNSPSMVNVFKKAKEMEMHTIAFTGLTGGEMKEYTDILLNIPSKETPRIQEIHILIGHIICQKVEERMVEVQQ